MCIWELARYTGYGWDSFEKNVDKALSTLKNLPNDFTDAKFDIGRL